MKNSNSFIDIYDFNKESYVEFLNDENSFKKQLDDFGNLVLREDIEEENIQEVGKFIIKITPKKKKLNNEQVEQFMPTNMSEFSPNTQSDEDEYKDIPGDFSDEIESEIQSQLDQERIMSLQIEEMSEILDKEIERGVQFQEKSSENFTAAKELIISQRIKLGEGTSASDFDNKFPFLPLKENQSEETDKFPFSS